jgi:hypothetical protein
MYRIVGKLVYTFTAGNMPRRILDVSKVFSREHPTPTDSVQRKLKNAG